MTKTALTCLAMLALTPLAPAQSCGVPPVKFQAAPYHAPYHGYAAQNYHNPAYFPIAVFTPVPLFTVQAPAPAAEASAKPAMPAAPAGEMGQVLQALQQTNQSLKDLDGRLRKLEAAQDQPIPLAPAVPAKPKAQSAAPAAHPGLLVVQAKCASCHEAKVAAEKGGGLALTDGAAAAKLDDRAARKVLSLAYAGKMPPKSSGVPALTDPEVGALVQWIDSMK